MKPSFHQALVSVLFIPTSALAGIVSNLVSDPGFETTLNPNPGTNAVGVWEAIESSNFSTNSESTFFRSGANAVVFNFYFDDPYLTQNLGTQIAAGKDYEYDFWVTAAEPGSNTLASTIDFEIWTSPTVNGTFTLAKQVTITVANTSGTFTRETGSITSTGLLPKVGEFMQIRFQPNAGRKDHVFVDDVQFGEAVPVAQPAPQLAFENGSTTPDIGIAGITATLTLNGTTATSSAHGSNDASYGTVYSTAPTSAGAFTLANNDSLTLKIQNASNGTLRLSSFHLDFSPRNASAPKDLMLAYTEGDLNDSPLGLGGLSGLSAVSNDLDDLSDLSIELRAKLIDATLDAGESATFTITSTNATGSGLSTLDNIGLYATLTPYVAAPPATLPTVCVKSKPNVVVVFSDDVGQGDLSCYGFGSSTKISTPNLDALAATGMRFTNAHSPAALCAPSRYGILCGNSPFRGRNYNGSWQLQGPSQILSGQKTTGDLFQAAGYHTAFIGKMHMGGDLYSASNPGSPMTGANFNDVDWTAGMIFGPSQFGFDYSFLCHGGIQDPPYIYLENEKAVDQFVQSATPPFAWSWVNHTHASYIPNNYRSLTPADHTPAVVQGDPALPDFNPSGVAKHVIEDPDGDQNFSYLHVADDPAWDLVWENYDTTKSGEVFTQAALNFIDDHMSTSPDDPFYIHFATQSAHLPHTPDTFFGQPVAGQELTPHLDLIRELDLQVKMLIDHLTSHGVMDNTIFIFTSDNGGLNHSSTGLSDAQDKPDISINVGHDTSGPYRSAKSSSYEGGHRVPFLIRWGDGTAANSAVPPGTVSDQLISQTDLYATFATILDLPQDANQGLESTNILPYFLGHHHTTLKTANMTTNQPGGVARIHLQSGDWKIIASVTGGSQTYTASSVSEMYHLATDPAEESDLAGNSAYASIESALLAELNSMAGNSRSTTAQDSDADGLFDDWEMATAGDLGTYGTALLSSTADSDNDGRNDAEEYAFRSNPAVADQAQSSTCIEEDPASNAIKFSWQSTSGRFYQIESSSDLTTWTSAHEGRVLGNGSTQEISFPINPADPRKFYRLGIAK